MAEMKETERKKNVWEMRRNHFSFFLISFSFFLLFFLLDFIFLSSNHFLLEDLTKFTKLRTLNYGRNFLFFSFPSLSSLFLFSSISYFLPLFPYLSLPFLIFSSSFPLCFTIFFLFTFLE